MADELNTTGTGTETPTGTGTPTGGGTPSGTPTPTSTQTPTGGGDVSARLAALEAEAAQLRAFRDNSLKVLRPDTEEKERVEATRSMLRQSGVYTEAQINAYIEQEYGATGDTNNQTGGGDTSGVDEVRAELRQTQVRMLEQDLTSAVQATGEDNTEIGRLLMKATAINGGDATGVDKRKALVLGEVRKAALETLRVKKAQNGGKFDPSWVKDAVNSAQAEVVGKYKMLWGDFATLGRAQQPIADQYGFTTKPAVKPPAWSTGKQLGDMQGELDAYNTDALSRLVVDKLASTGSVA